MPSRRRLNRASVIEQAAVLADAAGGVNGVSQTSLAEALGIRTPSLYNHISGLDDLHYGLAVYGLRLLLTDLRRATQGLVGRESILALAHTYRRFALTHPGLYPLVHRAPDPEETELLDVSQELLQFILLHVASLGLQGDDAIHAIRGLRTILHGFVSLEMAGGFKMVLDREDSFDHILDVYLSGLET